MKIAVCGSGGTGKTTLVHALAARFHLSIVSESYDDFFNDDFEFIAPPVRLKAKIVETLVEKNRLEAMAEHFVADRCAADLFNLWLTRGFGVDRRETKRIYRTCREYMTKYDFVVVTPWSAIPLRQVEESTRRRRTMNEWTQLHNHATIIGLLSQWVLPDRLLPIPFDVNEIERRVDFLAQRIRI